MSNRLMELEEQISPQEDDPEVESAKDENEGGPLLAARSLGVSPAPRQAQGRRRRRARSLAAARPVGYRVPGAVPHIAQTGSMSGWASAVAMLMSWREHASLSVQEAIGRLGPSYADFLSRNTGLPAAEKAGLLAAAGLQANPPMAYKVDDWERLLREKGPLWVTGDDRDGNLFATQSRIVVGIRGRGNRVEVDTIDPAAGREARQPLGAMVRAVTGDAGARPQVIYVGQHAPTSANGRVQVPSASAQSSASRYSQARVGPAAGAVIGAGWEVVKDLLMSGSSDITYDLEKMEGIRNPNDEVRWQTTPQMSRYTYEVFNEISGPDSQSVRFEVQFQANGHSIGNIRLVPIGTNDALGWQLRVTSRIVPRLDRDVRGANPVCAMEVAFNFRHTCSLPLVDDMIYDGTDVIMATGAIHRSGRWTQ